MTIRVLSFDFDGCLFNLDYINKTHDVIQSNMALLNQIKQENDEAKHNKVITFVGSNRQSKAVDLANSPGKGSCFPAVQQVNQFLGTSLDSFLLADVYGQLPAGTSFNRAIDKENKLPDANWMFDHTKATILYAQMHKTANEHPNEAITFDFYDDRQDILDALNKFYKYHQHLMPSNVTLRLHRYDGNLKSPNYSDIQGTGDINIDYRKTVVEMALIAAGEDSSIELNVPDVFTWEFAAREINTAVLNFDAETLKTQKPLPMDGTQLVFSYERPHENDDSDGIEVIVNEDDILETGCENAAFTTYADQLALLEKKVMELAKRKHWAAAQSAYTLHETLAKYYNLYTSNQLTPEEFKKNSMLAIEESRPNLEQHRGAKEILANIGLAILGLVGLYVAAGLVNLAVTGGRHFFFRFNTASANQLNSIENAINQIAPDISA